MSYYLTSIRFTGTQINYFFVCKRKLWLFTHRIEMETESDAVLIGKLLHEASYQRQTKEIVIDDTIKIDFLDGKGVIHEIKKSDKLEKPHEYQLLYYLYYLKQKGVTNLKGEINYPKLKKKVAVELTPEKCAELEQILKGVSEIISREESPPIEKMGICKKCSYYELCMV